MISEWPIVRLGDISQRITKGTTPTTVGGRFTEEGIAFVKVESIDDEGRLLRSKIAFIDERSDALLSRSRLEADDVLFTIAGTIGRVAIVGPSALPANTNQAVAIIRPDNKAVAPRFLYYALRDQPRVAKARTRVVQSVQANFSLKELSLVEVPLPPRDEQDRVADLLGALDDKIDLNRRMNETLEQIARTLFKAWFVDFDGAKSLVPSEFGSIPRGWSVAVLGDIVETMIGGDWGKDKSAADHVGVRCLRGVDLHKLRTSGWSDAPIRYVKLSSLSKRAPSENDLLVEGSGRCGRTIRYSASLAGLYTEPIVYSNFCKRLRARTRAQAVYVEHLLNDMVASGEMGAFITGTAMPNLDLHGLLTGKLVVLPPTSQLETWADTVLMARDRLFSGENRTLSTIRDTLLPKLISGEIRIPDAERIVSEVT